MPSSPGGGSGIVEAIAIGYARAGAKVAVLDMNGDGAALTALADADAGYRAI